MQRAASQNREKAALWAELLDLRSRYDYEPQNRPVIIARLELAAKTWLRRYT